MALSKYEDIYSYEEYSSRVSSINSEIETQVNIFKKDQLAERSKLREELKSLREKESRLFENFEGVKTIDDLNKRLEEYKEAAINFGGVSLKEIVIKALQQDQLNLRLKFDKAIKTYFNTYIKEKGENLIDFNNISQKIKEAYFSHLNSGKTDKKFKFNNKKLFENGFHPSEMSEAQREFFNKNPKFKKIYDETEITQEENILSSVFYLNNYTRGLKESEAREEFPKGSKELEEINNNIIEDIINKMITNGNNKANDEALVRNIIKYILGKNAHAFFIGDSFNSAIGLFGEIRGMFFLARLLGGKEATKIPKGLKWKGGTYSGDNNKKPHQDIAWKNFGIQIKNTIGNENDIGSVNFTELNLDSFLDRVNITNESTRNLFINYFGTLSFNVPYKKNKKGNFEKATSSPHEGFNKSYKSLREKNQDISTLLSIGASILTYLSVSKKIPDSNVLFLAGTSFFTASTILADILESLEKDDHNHAFRVRHSLKDNGRNIVVALNNSERGDPNFSEITLNSIKLTSSYHFTK